MKTFSNLTPSKAHTIANTMRLRGHSVLSNVKCGGSGIPEGKVCHVGEGEGAPKEKKGADAYLSEKIDYGGEMMSRGAVIADLKKQGASQANIDRYLQGSALGGHGAKESWQMTAKEYLDTPKGTKDLEEAKAFAKGAGSFGAARHLDPAVHHERAVKKAVAEGKKVPQNVLDEYGIKSPVAKVNLGDSKKDSPPAPEGGPEAYKAWVDAGKSLPATHPLGLPARKLWAQLSLGVRTPKNMTVKELETAAAVGRTAPKHDVHTDKLRAISDELTKRKSNRIQSDSADRLDAKKQSEKNWKMANRRTIDGIRQSLQDAIVADPRFTKPTTSSELAATPIASPWVSDVLMPENGSQWEAVVSMNGKYWRLPFTLDGENQVTLGGGLPQESKREVRVLYNKKCGASGIPDGAVCRVGGEGSPASTGKPGLLRKVKLPPVSHEKEGRNLMEWENEDLTLPELQKKLKIAEEAGGEDYVVKVTKEDIIKRMKVSNKMANAKKKLSKKAAKEFQDAIAEHAGSTDKKTAAKECGDLQGVMDACMEGRMDDAAKMTGEMEDHVKQAIPKSVMGEMKNRKTEECLDDEGNEVDPDGEEAECNKKGGCKTDTENEEEDAADTELENAITEHQEMMAIIDVRQGKADVASLRNIQKLLKDGKLLNALKAARELDPELRQIVPQTAWLKMRGIKGPLLNGSKSYQQMMNQAHKCKCAMDDEAGETSPDDEEEEKIMGCDAKDKEYKNALAEVKAIATLRQNVKKQSEKNWKAGQ